MNFLKSQYIFKFCTILLLIILTSGVAKSSIPDSLKSNSSDTVSKVSRHALYTGAGYGSNMIYLGSTISGNQPFGYAALTYGFKNELFAGISALKLFDNDPESAFYTGSLGYSHVFNSWFDISTSVSGYMFGRPVIDTLFSNFIYSDLTLGFDWNLLYSKISIGALITDEINPYLQIRNSRFFQTGKFIKDKAYISFDPYFNLIFGNLIESETTYGTLIKNPGFGRYNQNRPGPVYTSYSKNFGIMEIDLGIPVALNFDKAVIEAEASYVIPAYNDSELPGPKGFVFLLSGYFRIF